jgi:hypothetical protein
MTARTAEVIRRISIAVLLGAMFGGIAHGRDAASHANQAHRAVLRASDVRLSVPYALPVDEATYRAMLGQLPEVTIAINRDAVERLIVRHLDSPHVDLGDQRPSDVVAARVYETIIEPRLRPRIRAFNDGLNRAATGDTVSVGILAFTGLAKSMARRASNVVSSAQIGGVYRYTDHEFESGTWEWDDPGRHPTISGVSNHFSLAIDESVEIDLADFGVVNAQRRQTTFQIRFNCSAEVKIEQEYGAKYIGNESPRHAPETTLRFRPYVDVTTTQSVSGDSHFTISGERYTRIRERIEHRAIHEVEVKADRPDDTD